MIRRLFVYSREGRIRAIELWLKYNKNLAAVVRELGCPSTNLLVKKKVIIPFENLEPEIIFAFPGARLIGAVSVLWHSLQRQGLYRFMTWTSMTALAAMSLNSSLRSSPIPGRKASQEG